MEFENLNPKSWMSPSLTSPTGNNSSDFVSTRRYQQPHMFHVPLNILLCMPMFLRLYLICRLMVLHSKEFQVLTMTMTAAADGGGFGIRSGDGCGCR